LELRVSDRDPGCSLAQVFMEVAMGEIEPEKRLPNEETASFMMMVGLTNLLILGLVTVTSVILGYY
jgi:hypothetical protein